MAGNYRKISKLVWRDPRFRRAGTDAQIVLFWGWTGPEGNAAGVISTTPAAIAVSLDWTPERAEAALQSLVDSQLADVDNAAGIVAFDLFDFEGPENGSVVKHIGNILTDLPSSPVITRYLDRLREYCRLRGDDWRNGYATMVETLPIRLHPVKQGGIQGDPHPVPHTETETETERDTDTHPPTSGSGARARGNGGDLDGPESIGSILERMTGRVAP